MKLVSLSFVSMFFWEFPLTEDDEIALLAVVAVFFWQQLMEGERAVYRTRKSPGHVLFSTVSSQREMEVFPTATHLRLLS